MYLFCFHLVLWSTPEGTQAWLSDCLIILLSLGSDYTTFPYQPQILRLRREEGWQSRNTVLFYYA